MTLHDRTRLTTAACSGVYSRFVSSAPFFALPFAFGAPPAADAVCLWRVPDAEGCASAAEANGCSESALELGPALELDDDASAASPDAMSDSMASRNLVASAVEKSASDFWQKR